MEQGSIVLISSIIMFLGVLVTSLFGYLGSKEHAKSNVSVMKNKADQSLVEELKEEITELRGEVSGMKLRLQDCVEENIELMKKYIAANSNKT